MKDGRLRYFLVAGGNSTALVLDEQPDMAIVRSLLRSVEQVGFFDDRSRVLTMMGGEFCLNASLAACLLADGPITCAGVEVDGKTAGTFVTARVSLPYVLRPESCVIFEGIGFMVKRQPSESTSTESFAALCDKFQVPAFGVVVLEDDHISPTVFVKEVGVAVQESACGSGSVATAIVTGMRRIIQPTGKVITVQRSEMSSFLVGAEVTEFALHHSQLLAA